MSDSTALLSRCGTNYYFTDKLMSEERFEDLGCSLLLVDIRFEKIYWEKKVRNNDVILNAVLDSILFFIDRRNYYYYNYLTISKIATHRLGNENSGQITLKPKKIDLAGEGWKDIRDLRIRPWQSGLILAKLGNKYALLDTAVGTMELWQPIGEFEWLNDCVDAKWSSVGGLCLKSIPDTLGFVLLRNGVDTLAVRYMPYELPINHRILAFNGNSIISWGWFYLMNQQGQVSEKPLDVWAWMLDGFYFRDFHGNELDYNKKIVY